jgi:hypothetical protein
MTKDEALKLALKALETSMYPQQKQLQAITAIKEALAQQALDRKAENARELGLDYEPEQEPVGLIESLKDAQPCCGEYQTCWRACTPRGKFLAQRTWVGLMRGVRVEGDTVVISVKGGNDAARELCGALIEEMNR